MCLLWFLDRTWFIRPVVSFLDGCLWLQRRSQARCKAGCGTSQNCPAAREKARPEGFHVTKVGRQDSGEGARVSNTSASQGFEHFRRSIGGQQFIIEECKVASNAYG